MSDMVAAADQMAQEGVQAEVIDLRTISPWDQATVLASVARTRRAVVVHEAVQQFGVGAEISSRIHEELFGELAGPVARVASKNVPVPFARSLEDAYVYQVVDIVEAARRLTQS
ncbi:transketolase C-terminal domain-containing protein [Phytohabitans suffuscus]|uniref:transketolase C-terminal domain-containing protein n=1 Tax=Phytohabitans suffuscus TaxID=624315 RepID=UPI001E317F73|nr:transketolase C-terminal domain-containing protein [Phytohabitans suffuscus]